MTAAVMLPAGYDRLDVVAQLLVWRDLVRSRRFRCMMDEAIGEIRLARQDRDADHRPH